MKSAGVRWLRSRFSCSFTLCGRMNKTKLIGGTISIILILFIPHRRVLTQHEKHTLPHAHISCPCLIISLGLCDVYHLYQNQEDSIRYITRSSYNPTEGMRSRSEKRKPRHHHHHHHNHNHHHNHHTAHQPVQRQPTGPRRAAKPIACQEEQRLAKGVGPCL